MIVSFSLFFLNPTSLHENFQHKGTIIFPSLLGVSQQAAPGQGRWAGRVPGAHTGTAPATGGLQRTSPSAPWELFGFAVNSLIPPPLPDQWQHSNFTEDIRSTSKTTIKLLSALIDILALTNPSMCSITQFKRLASPPGKSSPCF